MEATIVAAGWIYDVNFRMLGRLRLLIHALMLRAIAAAKRKNDKIDAVRFMTAFAAVFTSVLRLTSTEILRDRRHFLRYRSLLVKQTVQMREPDLVALDA